MKKKVLVVDNNPFFLEVIKKSLEPAGYRVSTFDDPLLALETIKKENFDYILVDHIMPKIDGTRLCGYLKDQPSLKQTPVIVLTGVAVEASARVKEINADAYIAKSPVPNFIADLLSVIGHYESGKDPEDLKNTVFGVDKIFPREMTREFIEIESHLSQLLSTMSEGIIECDQDYRIFFANRAAIGFLGCSETDLIGKNLFKALGIDRTPDLKAFFPTTTTLKKKADFSTQFCLALGERIFSIHVNALQTTAIAHGVLIVLEDVTELSMKINALSTVNTFARILTSELELEDVIKRQVSAFREFTGAETAVYMLFREAEPGELIVKEVSGQNKKLAPGALFTSPFLVAQCALDEPPPIYLTDDSEIQRLFPFLTDGVGYAPRTAIVQTIKVQHRCLGCIIFFSDVQPFKPFSQDLFDSLTSFSGIALENAIRYRRLKELNIWRQNYMANISHELRTPLTIVKGFNEILCGNMLKDEESRKVVLGNMLNEVNKLARLIDNLLTISKFENIPAILKIKHARIDLHDVIAECIRDIGGEVVAKGISLVTRYHENPLFTEGDRELLTQSIYHLLSNALKYSYAEGRVELATTVSGNLAFITIRDYGAGIPREQMNRVFEKFYMVDAGPDKSTRGAGIGLYLVREIVNLHYGNIQMESEPGKGTQFTIKLPLYREEF